MRFKLEDKIMDKNGILGVTNYKWVTCGIVVLPMVLDHGFVKPQMVFKWKITIKGGLGEVFESSIFVCKTGCYKDSL